LFHPAQDLIFTTSKDKTARVWRPDEKAHRAIHTVNVHHGEVVGCTLHATGDYWVTASADGTWAFHSIETAKTLLQVVEPDQSPLTCSMLHPDGVILATGTDANLIRIWDLKSKKNMATFQGHKGAITDLRFSENGYYLATSAMDNQVKLWDLRKLKSFHSFDLPEDYALTSIDFDHSGTYLAAAGDSELRIFTIGKTFELGATISGHSGIVTDVKWGRDSKFLATTSLDRNLKFWE